MFFGLFLSELEVNISLDNKHCIFGNNIFIELMKIAFSFNVFVEKNKGSSCVC